MLNPMISVFNGHIQNIESSAIGKDGSLKDIMMHAEYNTLKQTPGLVTWLFWVALTTSGGILGTAITILNPNSNAFLNQLFIWFFLAGPLFCVTVGQWFLLHRLVEQAHWWLLTAILGFIFVIPYLIYGFSAEFSNGKSLIFGTPEFWYVSLSLTIMSLIFGGFVGLVQSALLISRYGAQPKRVLWWTISTALAWAIGYPLGDQFLGSLFWLRTTPSPLTAGLLIEGTKWGIIGIITGTALVWLGRKTVQCR